MNRLVSASDASANVICACFVLVPKLLVQLCGPPAVAKPPRPPAHEQRLPSAPECQPLSIVPVGEAEPEDDQLLNTESSSALEATEKTVQPFNVVVTDGGLMVVVAVLNIMVTARKTMKSLELQKTTLGHYPK
jgi:hypothetical protein